MCLNKKVESGSVILKIRIRIRNKPFWIHNTVKIDKMSQNAFVLNKHFYHSKNCQHQIIVVVVMISIQLTYLPIR